VKKYKFGWLWCYRCGDFTEDNWRTRLPNKDLSGEYGCLTANKNGYMEEVCPNCEC
jgi:hypothetical protein